MRRTMRITVGVIVLMLISSACTKGDAGSSKAGGDAPPIVLTIGTDDQPGKPASDQIEEFARQVAELSEGSITIEPVWHAAGDGSDWDQRVARMVVSGELDMGNIPARAWDTEGVTSLRALNAPFLITSDELTAEVITSDLADEMLSGLEDIGIVGLALLPEGLRHPFGLNEPLMGIDDYEGKVIRTPTSATTRALYEALGATVTDTEPNASTQAAMESAYVLGPVGNATGNVTFYPKVNSLVMNAAAFEGLSDAQRSILRDAAIATRDWAIDNQPSDSAGAAAFCELGHAVTLASADDVASLQAAAAKVYEQFADDDLTLGLISDIEEMATHVDVVAPAAGCGDPSPIVAGGSGSSTVLDGIYRFEVTEDQLRSAGVSESEIRGLTGVYTWTFANGNVSFVQTGPYPESEAADGADHFVVEGDQLTIVWPDGLTEVFSWTTNGNGDLYLTIVSVPEEWLAVDTVYTSIPWVRMGDVASVDIPDGIYRSEVRLTDVEEAGYRNDDGWTGTWTLVLSHGTYSMTCKILDNPSVDCGHSGGTDDVLEAGYATVEGDTVSFVYDAGIHSELSGCQMPCFPLPTYEIRWSLQGEDLVFADRQASDNSLVGLEKVLAPWIRIGDLETVEAPQGTFRVEHTVAGLTAAGVSPTDAPNYAGIWTLTFTGGVLEIDDTVGGTCHGTYVVDENRLSLLLGNDPACGSAANGEFFSADWRLGPGFLRFVDLSAPSDHQILETLFSDPVWTKIS